MTIYLRKCGGINPCTPCVECQEPSTGAPGAPFATGTYQEVTSVGASCDTALAPGPDVNSFLFYPGYPGWPNGVPVTDIFLPAPCIGLPFDAVVDLEWTFTFSDVVGTIEVIITLDKSAGTYAATLNGSWTATLADPGFDTTNGSTDTSAWVTVTGAKARFRIACAMSTGRLTGDLYCTSPDVFTYIFGGASLYIEWEAL